MKFVTYWRVGLYSPFYFPNVSLSKFLHTDVLKLLPDNVLLFYFPIAREAFVKIITLLTVNALTLNFRLRIYNNIQCFKTKKKVFAIRYYLALLAFLHSHPHCRSAFHVRIPGIHSKSASPTCLFDLGVS